MRNLIRRFKTWWSKPITIEIETTCSPDWEGDARKYRERMRRR